MSGLVTVDPTFTSEVTQSPPEEEDHEHLTYLVAVFQGVFPLQSSRIAGHVFLVIIFIFFFQFFS